ncbi:MAG: tetratricopeptide repeat protein [Anaerolineae bacterium]
MRFGYLSTRSSCAYAYMTQGFFDKALAYMEEANKGFQELADPNGTMGTRLNMGHITRTMGDHDAARRHYCTALAQLIEHPSPEIICEVLAAVGALQSDKGEYARSAELLGLARAQQRFTPDARKLVEETLPAVREKLGGEATEAALKRGENLTVEDEIKRLHAELCAEA